VSDIKTEKRIEHVQRSSDNSRVGYCTEKKNRSNNKINNIISYDTILIIDVRIRVLHVSQPRGHVSDSTIFAEPKGM
jgi:hypothetical protein